MEMREYLGLTSGSAVMLWQPCLSGDKLLALLIIGTEPLLKELETVFVKVLWVTGGSVAERLSSREGKLGKEGVAFGFNEDLLAGVGEDVGKQTADTFTWGAFLTFPEFC